MKKLILREELYKIIGIEAENSTYHLIAKEILRRLDDGEKLNSSDIAARTYTSKPTVVRFAQKFGFQGFKEFKDEMLFQDRIYYFHTTTLPYDEAYQLYQFSLEFQIENINKNFSIIKEIAQLIETKHRLFIFASPENFVCANIFADRLRFLGIEVYSAINNKQVFFANIIKSDDLAIFIVSGFDNFTLESFWNRFNPTLTTFLLSSASQSLKFLEPDYFINIKLGQTIFRGQLKYFAFNYVLDQILNLLVYSQQNYIDYLSQPKHRL